VSDASLNATSLSTTTNVRVTSGFHSHLFARKIDLFHLSLSRTFCIVIISERMRWWGESMQVTLNRRDAAKAINNPQDESRQLAHRMRDTQACDMQDVYFMSPKEDQMQ
jgi:hypothetical protein